MLKDQKYFREYLAITGSRMALKIVEEAGRGEDDERF
jgi:hypothetical protein